MSEAGGWQRDAQGHYVNQGWKLERRVFASGRGGTGAPVGAKVRWFVTRPDGTGYGEPVDTLREAKRRVEDILRHAALKAGPPSPRVTESVVEADPRNPSTPERIAQSLAHADAADRAHRAAWMAAANRLPDGTAIRGWVKHTLGGDVLWIRQGKKGTADVTREVGAKAVADALRTHRLPVPESVAEAASLFPPSKAWALIQANLADLKAYKIIRRDVRKGLTIRQHNPRAVFIEVAHVAGDPAAVTAELAALFQKHGYSTKYPVTPGPEGGALLVALPLAKKVAEAADPCGPCGPVAEDIMWDRLATSPLAVSMFLVGPDKDRGAEIAAALNQSPDVRAKVRGATRGHLDVQFDTTKFPLGWDLAAKTFLGTRLRQRLKDAGVTLDSTHPLTRTRPRVTTEVTRSGSVGGFVLGHVDKPRKRRRPQWV